MANARYVVGVDVGTTTVKGALFDFTGACLGQVRVAYPTRRHGGVEVEQDPNDWLRATERILRELLTPVSLKQVAGIGFCGQTNTHAFVDTRGEPLCPAIAWQDTRCEEEARRLDGYLTDAQRMAWWGAPSHIAASHTVSKIAWLMTHRPDLWQRVDCILTPKDYCLAHLTGRRVTDPLSYFDLVDLNGEYIEPLIDLVPGARRRLPRLQKMESIAGPCAHGALSDLGIPVMAGTMDGWASLCGSGVSQAGEGAWLSGTSEIVVLASDRRVNVPGVVSFMPVNGWHVHAGPTQSGADSLRWFAEVLGRSIEEVLALAATVERDAARVLFLPHLQGERAPLWDSESRGAFLGLTASTSAADLALSVLEGVALSAKLLFDEASKAAARQYEWLYLGGGGSQSDEWCQIRADVMGVELRRCKFTDAGVLGAAMIAAVGAGEFPTVSEAARRMARVETVFKPTARYASRYTEALDVYKGAYHDLKATNRRLA